jgi:arylsulfatase A-like enzyme
MTSPRTVIVETPPLGSFVSGRGTSPLGLLSTLLLSAWCGLVAGLLEVATILLRKALFDSNQLFGMSRHFVWMIPLIYLCLFIMLGMLGCFAHLERTGHGRRLFSRVLCALTLLPIALVAFPQIYYLAWLAVALGAGVRLVPWIERHARAFRSLVQVSFPLALGIVAILWASLWVPDQTKQSQENARPLPPAGSPNVVLIVMDTVAAGHLSLHGYQRPTSTTLIELAEHAIKFDSAQAAAPWTLPSHASMFTGRWMHELSVGWLTPLDKARPTLADFLGAKGYATAGFVANTPYCANDSGLDRGFTLYRDFGSAELSVLKLTALLGPAIPAIRTLLSPLDDSPESDRALSVFRRLGRWIAADRKTAAQVNREFVGWLSQRPQPARPFFAFLNYFDAHYPYQLPKGRFRRFSGTPMNPDQSALLDSWWDIDKKSLPPQQVAFAAGAYDDCIADLDEQLGKLIDKLRRRGDLDRTWLIIASDHGESFGEHTGIFCHGTSLYQTELHVPLLIVPPGGRAAGRVVKDAVSLRDLAATIVDVTGQNADSPFPGQTLARFWNGTRAQPRPSSDDRALAEVVPNPNQTENRNSAGAPQPNWPLGSLHETGWSYIRREGNVREELYHLRDDPKEERNLAADQAAQSTLERMRQALGQITAGPLMPNRFKP